MKEVKESETKKLTAKPQFINTQFYCTLTKRFVVLNEVDFDQNGLKHYSATSEERQHMFDNGMAVYFQV